MLRDGVLTCDQVNGKYVPTRVEWDARSGLVRRVLLRGGPWDGRRVETDPREERFEVTIRALPEGWDMTRPEPPPYQRFTFWYAPTEDPEVWAVTEDSPPCEIKYADPKPEGLSGSIVLGGKRVPVHDIQFGESMDE